MAKTVETVDRCTQYAVDVVAGKINAGEYVRLACQRHLDDLERATRRNRSHVTRSSVSF